MFTKNTALPKRSKMADPWSSPFPTCPDYHQRSLYLPPLLLTPSLTAYQLPPPLSLSIAFPRSVSCFRSKVKPLRPSGVLLLFPQVVSSPLRRCTQRCGCGDAARTTEARSDGLYSTLQYDCSTCWSGRAPPTPSNPNQRNIHRPICCIRNVCISIWSCQK